ncbi:transcriptional regulator, SARP family [Catenulispora acidiphila DSM 44928]|uniref:Transcriptional regulator, SARP family n=1 Tax=Catenulispora acidiphila (strain DSM 44928 / JCM 14897 / NBRC 102108 / NRRL B-24433 / ID139908) TaxID=479433 RepID=C7QC35_CATAD|nr:AfsR/SARP family transcriptional regulator [Catenulispora acidiphila]ACU72654.1 transcriptional regulator, SARP family [Catenulispora acidiphila DSM 44928]
MRFGVLGPLLAHDGSADRRIVAPKQQVILATMLLNANRVVSVERIAENLWADAAPGGAHKTLHTYVMRLRRSLGTAADRVRTEARGYRFVVQDGELDLHRFTALVEAAKARSAEQAWESAADLLHTALGVWRGQPLQGVQSVALSGEVDRLAELRLDALLARIDADLHLDRHELLVPELRDLVVRQPLLERAHSFLMLALYRASRRADALAAFRSARRVLAEELGIEPGRDLQRLHGRILNADPALNDPAWNDPAGSSPEPRFPSQPAPDPTSDAEPAAPAPHPAAPAQLPRGIRDFTGRDHELERIKTLLSHDPPGSVPAPGVCVIAGAGGTGKSALAVQVAHAVRDRFPDGQLYLDLRGADRHPVDPGHALAEFIRALGDGGSALPEGVADRSAVFRTMLADRRVLILLDDAGDVQQVRPLLPADPRCCVIITSRSRLPGLEDCARLELGSLSPQDGASLFGKVVGDERPQSEPAAVARIVELCGGLPLAIRIAGSRLAVRRTWRLESLAARLGDTARRLDELRTDDLQVRATLDMSYQHLTGDQARAFRLLAVPDVDSLSVWHAAVHLDVPARTAETLLESLVDAFLLEPAGAERYRYHDLTRVFAREAASVTESAEALAGAAGRTLAAYAELLAHAAAAARPGYLDESPPALRFGTAHEALDWLDQEFRAVGGLIVQAGSGPADAVGVAADMLYRVQWYLRSRGHWRLWHDAAAAVIDGAVRTGDTAAELVGRQSSGLLALLTGRFEESDENLSAAVGLAERLDDSLEKARVLNRRGLLDFQRGFYREAVADHEAAADLFKRLGNRLGECASLVNIGKCLRVSGEPARALAHLERALALSEELGESENATMARHHLAACHSELGNHETAISAQYDCLVFTREHGLREGEAFALAELGRALLRADRALEALESFEEAMDLFSALGDPNAVAVFLADSGFAHQRLGDLAAATSAWRAALPALRPDTREAGAVREVLGAYTHEEIHTSESG